MTAAAPTPEPTWPRVLGALSVGADLSADQARWAMTQILQGQATDAQVGAFAMGLRAKGESPAEVGVFVDVMLGHAHRVPLEGDFVALDVVGTGGDQSGSVNISTMSALVCASLGAPIVKHGNRAASSLTGTADVLEELGVAIDLTPEQVEASVREAGIGFCLAPLHHPSLRHAAPARRELGVPTVFNILGPLTNPGGAMTALVGCANRDLAPVMADVLHERGVSAIVVRSEGGMDEIVTSGPTRVWDATGARVVEFVLTPQEVGLAQVDPVLLAGGDRARNAHLLRAALSGGAVQGPDAPAVQAIRDVVALNSAAAMVAFESAGQRGSGSLVERITAWLPRTSQAIAEGRAMTLLQQWIDVTRRLRGA